MRESVFNAEVVRSLRQHGAYAFKLPDIPASMLTGLRYAPEKPCDIIGHRNGIFFAIESKQLRSFQAFGMRHMRPGQIIALDNITACGGQAFVFLNARVKADRENGIKRVNSMIFFKWKMFRARSESFKKGEVEALVVTGGVHGSLGVFNLTGFLSVLKEGHSP